MHHNDFIKQAFQIAQDSFGEWEFQENTDMLLYNKMIVIGCESSMQLESIDIDIDMDEMEIPQYQQDIATLNPSTQSIQQLKMECHVIYSEIWSCPVVYFEVRNVASGISISLPKLYNLLHQSPSNVSISQTFHPLLNRPFYYLHPCQTNVILQEWEHEKEPLRLWMTMMQRELGFIFESNGIIKSL